MTEHSVGVDDAGGVSDRKTTTTVAMDFGRIALPGVAVAVPVRHAGPGPLPVHVGRPGPRRDRRVVLVDTDRLDQCFPAVDYFESRGIPFVVGVNCFDGVAKHQLDDVREALAIPAHVPVLYTGRALPGRDQAGAHLARAARDGASARTVILV